MSILARPGSVPRPAAAVSGGGPEKRSAWPAAGGRAWFAAVVALVLGKTVLVSRTVSTDSYYDLYAGRYVVHHGIPHTNVITVASHGAAWIDQQWLAQVLLYGAWAAGGYRALAAFSAALVTAGFAVLAMAMLRRGVPPVRAFTWTTVAFIVCLGNTAVRVQSIAYLFLGLTLWLVLEDDRASRLRGRTWLIVPVLVLWANMHGSVLLGAALAALYAGYRAAASAVRRDLVAALAYLTLGGAAGAAVLCTPYGTQVVAYYRATVGNPVFARYVPEWAPPSLTNPQSWAFFAFAALVLVTAGVAWGRGARPGPVPVGLAVALLALALTGTRFQAWFAFGGSLLAADMLARASGGRAPAFGARFRRAVAGLLAGLAALSLALLAVTPDRHFEAGIPRQAVGVAAAIAARNPAVNILADDVSSNPLLWLHPATVGRVAFDARLEQYSAAEIGAYFDFVNALGPRWPAMTRGYDIVVCARNQAPWFAAAMRGLPGWRVVYQDHSGMVAVRTSARLSLP